MAKVKPVKWSLSSSEPDDLQDFLSNDEIVAKNRKGKEVEWPSKGPHTFIIRFLKVKPNKNGDDRISVMAVMQNPKKTEDAAWNGYAIFDGFNVVEGTGLSFLKRFLKALGLTWDDFIKRSKQDDQDPPHIVQIGSVKFESKKDVTVQAMVKIAPADDYNDDEHMEITRYIPLESTGDAPDESGEPEEGVTVLGAGKKKKGKKAKDEPSREEQEAALREELDSLDKEALQERALKNNKKAKVDGLKKKGLVELVFGQEMPPF